jgi:hypothetical protein
LVHIFPFYRELRRKKKKDEEKELKISTEKYKELKKYTTYKLVSTPREPKVNE